MRRASRTAGPRSATRRRSSRARPSRAGRRPRSSAARARRRSRSRSRRRRSGRRRRASSPFRTRNPRRARRDPRGARGRSGSRSSSGRVPPGAGGRDSTPPASRAARRRAPSSVRRGRPRPRTRAPSVWAAPRAERYPAVEIAKLARDRLGLEQLRPGQEEAVRSVTAARDTLAAMPTGAGKSAIYQLAALILDGPTIVVSPLLALQRDQVESIGADDAVALNSQLSHSRREDVFERLEQGLEFVLLAPEQLADEAVVERLAALQPSLFV